MTTSSNPTSPPPPNPRVDHWSELTATLPEKRVDELAAWIDRELAVMESRLGAYVTAKSLKRSLGR